MLQQVYADLLGRHKVMVAAHPLMDNVIPEGHSPWYFFGSIVNSLFCFLSPPTTLDGEGEVTKSDTVVVFTWCLSAPYFPTLGACSILFWVFSCLEIARLFLFDS